MLRTIFLYEWKLLLRSKAIVIALLLFTGIGWLSVNKGVGYYNYQQQESDSIAVRNQRNLASLQKQFDTLDFAQKEKHDVENPWTFDSRLGEYAIKPANALSALSIGQNDVYARFKRTRFSTEIFSNELDEFKNPEQLLTGNLDLSYFILFLFPLLFIAISYNTASADKEAGINKLLASQSGNLQKVIAARVIFRWLLALLPVFISVALAWWQIRNKTSFSYSHFFQWLGISLLYAFFWLSIVLFIISRGWNSMVNALSLAGIWLLLLVGIPGILNSWYQYKYPNYIQQEVTQLRDDKSKYADLPLPVHKENFYKRFPSLIKDSATVDTTELRWCSYAMMGIEREKQVYNSIAAKTTAQNKKEEQFFWINPVGGLTRAFNTVSGSTLHNKQHFETSILDLRMQKAEYLFGNFFAKPHFAKAELAGVPKYKPEAAASSGLIIYLWPTMLITVLSIVGYITGRKRNIL